MDRGRWRRSERSAASLSVEPWSVTETTPDGKENAARESLFSLGNGYLGIRGTFEEGAPPAFETIQGTYLNGFHERGEIVYPEDAYGFARVRQTMLNVIDGTSLAITLDGEPVSLSGAVTQYSRRLDLRAGTLERSYVWRGGSGKRARLNFLRVISFASAPRAAQRLIVEPLDGPMELTVTHTLDGRVENRVEHGDPRVGSALTGQILAPLSHVANEEGLLLHMRAPKSAMEIVCAAAHEFSPSAATREVRAMPLAASARFDARIEEAASLEIRLIYLDDRKALADDLTETALRELAAFGDSGGLSSLLEEQRAWLGEFWDRADVEVVGDDAVQQSLRFSLFHLLQGSGRDGSTNIASKALTGEGYEGHTFWDSEIYVVPVFAHAFPAVARSLLQYRIALLPSARERAIELRRAGALFPWRTIAGPEASAYYPAGTAQIHINADIVWAFSHYLEVTGDLDLMWEGGAEVVFECARFFSHYGTLGDDGRFHLHTVTGPDEYTALVDDNYFTNKMVKHTLAFAVDLASTLRADDAAAFTTLAAKLGLTPRELEDFAAKADVIHLAVDEVRAITPQDSSFLSKPEWPWAEVPAERYPLLLSYHPLDIYRHQVLKQADVLLAHYLLPDDVPRWRLRRDAEYYAARTTHDSSLSACAHAIVAAELNLLDTALAFFDATARTDLDDLQGNGDHGVHVAAMGGSWLTIAHGFAGMRPVPDGLSFRPRLPLRWERLRFRTGWRARVVEIDIDHDRTTYRLTSGEPMQIAHRGQRGELRRDLPLALSTRPRLRGVVFDLDGVLTDSAELHFRAWKALADELELPFDREINERLRGIDRMASLEIILEGASTSYSAGEKESLAARKNATYRALIAEVTPSDLLPGVPRLLDELRAAGLPLALASASRNAPSLLERLGLSGHFEAVIDPASLERGKPDPEIFERAAAALGLATDECVGVEDAEAGIAAILGAGMAAVGIGPADRLGAAHLVVPRTDGLRLEDLEAAHRAATGAY